MDGMHHIDGKVKVTLEMSKYGALEMSEVYPNCGSKRLPAFCGVPSAVQTPRALP